MTSRLLNKRLDVIEELFVTPQLLVAAAKNYYCSATIVAYLIIAEYRQRDLVIQPKRPKPTNLKLCDGLINDDALCATAASPYGMIKFGLLESRFGRIEIPQAAIDSAASQRSLGLVNLIYDRGYTMDISEEVLVAAARNGKPEVMTFLFKQNELKVTTRVIEAAGNWGIGEELLGLLFHRAVGVEV